MFTTGTDSTGQVVRVGDVVRYRGAEYIVEGFPQGRSRRGFPSVQLQGFDGDADDLDEVAIDLVRITTVDAASSLSLVAERQQ